MGESSIDRKLQRVRREIEEAQRRNAPLTPEKFEKDRFEPVEPKKPEPTGTAREVKDPGGSIEVRDCTIRQVPCGHCGLLSCQCGVWGAWWKTGGRDAFDVA